MLPSTSRPGPQAVAYSQELQLNDIFDQLSESFKALSSMSQSRQQVVLKEMTAKMQLAKT